MKRIVLFSTPTPNNIDKILEQIFPAEIKNKILAYMPSDSSNCPQIYRDEWKGYAQKYDAGFNYIDNSIQDTSKEINKLLNSNILVISGGNTFKLLYNLRISGLDKAIIEYAKKDNIVISGFSAGALVLTPTIQVCSLPTFDENLVGIEDLNGLGVVDFEVFPHYEESKHKEILDKYKSITKHEVRAITDEDFIVLKI